MFTPALYSSSSSILLAPRRFSTILSSTMPHISCSSSSPTSPISTPTTPVQSKPTPWLLVGLGNPGKMFTGTRHNVCFFLIRSDIYTNMLGAFMDHPKLHSMSGLGLWVFLILIMVGFEMLDAIADAEGISMKSASFKALIGKGCIGNVPVILAKPQTFMNASGESVGLIVSHYKIPLKQVLVIFDDLDLPFAKLRLLPKGGHGGQNGMRSIIKHFKDNRDFPRLRIGIGRPPGKMHAAIFVLRPFTKEERQELDFTFRDGVEAVRILLLEGFNKSATFVNSKKALEQKS